MKTKFLDMSGNVLFEDPFIYRRLFAVGQEIINDFKPYIVRSCAVTKDGMYVNVKLMEKK